LNCRRTFEAGLLAQAQTLGLTLEAYLIEHVLRGAVEKPGAERQGRKTLVKLFAESPLKGLDLKFERSDDTGRSVSL